MGDIKGEMPLKLEYVETVKNYRFFEDIFIILDSTEIRDD